MNDPTLPEALEGASVSDGSRLEQAPLFTGTDRFAVLSQLGRGGFGVVYEVLDKLLRAKVALKTITRAGPDRLYLFKSEFRALTDLYHPNLAQLYELHEHRGTWFFTMELVHGQNALAFSRATRSPEAFGQLDLNLPRASRPRLPSLDQGRPVFDERKLRTVLAQLGEGLSYLHEAGRLHRDIKPSNVQVSDEGRVVLLDFGLSLDLAAPHDEDEESAVGTPYYMSPEQAAGRPLGPASDWYSVGVMLYEALTGVRPVDGNAREVMERKQRSDPPKPSEIAPGVPRDLEELCLELMHRAPSSRPSGSELLARLGVIKARPSSRPAYTSTSPLPSPFIGRSAEQELLQQALEHSAQKATALLLHGESGIGKSALLRQFLEHSRETHPAAVLLAGRCNEHESVPFKALDSVVDALARHLRRLPHEQIERMLPDEISSLAALFPVLLQVDAINRRAVDAPDTSVGLRRRRRAIAALVPLLAALSSDGPLVLVVDNLQWGDLDSAALLAELLREGAQLPLLFIGAYRSEDAPRSPCLRALLPALEASGLPLRHLVLRELDALDAEHLAGMLLSDRTRHQQGAVARESGGHPLFLAELTRLLHDGIAEPTGGGPALSLDRVVRARIAQLPPPAQRLLEVAAIAGQPVEREAAQQAAGLGSEAMAVLGVLQGSRLLRATGQGRRAAIEIYHDRIRSAVLSSLDEESTRALHLALATALERGGRAEPEALAIHLTQAGEPQRAALYAATAADRAVEAIDFERAAKFYLLAIELHGEHDDWARALWVMRGDALVQCGLGTEAAASFLRAADGAPSPQSLDLERRAAEQLLYCGKLDEGLPVIHRVLAALDLDDRRGSIALRSASLFQRLRLWMRGLSYRERREDESAPLDLLRVDACYTATQGFQCFDRARASFFSTQHVRLALDVGEPSRILRALNLELSLAAARSGGHLTATEQRIHEMTQALAGSLRSPLAGASCDLTRSAVSYWRGDMSGALSACDTAEEVLRRLPTHSSGDLLQLRRTRVHVLIGLGDWREALAIADDLLAEAHERGDVYTESALRAQLAHLPGVLADDPATARAASEAALAQGTQLKLDEQRFQGQLSRVDVELLAGDAQGSLARLEAALSEASRAGVLMVQRFRALARIYRGRVLLALATQKPATARASTLDEVRSIARALRDEQSAWLAPFSQLFSASVQQMLGDLAQARAQLIAAAEGFDAAHSHHYAASCRHLLARLDSEGASADEPDWFAAQQCAHPTRLALMLCPGTWAR